LSVCILKQKIRQPQKGPADFCSDSRSRTCDQPVTNGSLGFPKGSDYLMAMISLTLGLGRLLRDYSYRHPLVSAPSPHLLWPSHKYWGAWLRIVLSFLRWDFPEFTRFSLHGFPWRLLTWPCYTRLVHSRLLYL